MSIESHLLHALHNVEQGRGHEEAMTLICSAVDATAGNEYGPGVGARIRRFVTDNLDIVTRITFGGVLTAYSGVALKLKAPGSPGVVESLEDIIYHIRNNQAHEASLPPNTSFSMDGFYGERNGGFEIPISILAALILAVIGSPSNAGRRLGGDVTIKICGHQFQLESLWGRHDIIRQQLGL